MAAPLAASPARLRARSPARPQSPEAQRRRRPQSDRARRLRSAADRIAGRRPALAAMAVLVGLVVRRNLLPRHRAVRRRAYGWPVAGAAEPEPVSALARLARGVSVRPGFADVCRRARLSR